MARTHWLISDTHFDHNNILKYCGRTTYMSEQEKKDYVRYKEESVDFKVSDKSTNRMNHDIIGNINDRVGPKDILWHLGDWGFGDNWEKAVTEYRNRIVCENIMFVFGNHDYTDKRNLQCFSQCFDLVTVCIFQDGGFITGDDVRWHWKKPGNTTITMCHYPLASWPRMERGTYHAYGHLHTNMEIALNNFSPGRKSVDVGVDNIYKLFGYYGPINLTQFKGLFS